MNWDRRPNITARTRIKLISTTSWIGKSLRRGQDHRHRDVLNVLAGGVLHVIATDERYGFPSESFGRTGGHVHRLIDKPIELVALPAPRDRHEHPQDLGNFHLGTLSLS